MQYRAKQTLWNAARHDGKNVGAVLGLAAGFPFSWDGSGMHMLITPRNLPPILVPWNGWLIQGPDGSLWALTDQQFHDWLEPVGEA